ncbi:alpha-galactosidase [Aquisphaera insulae]|uniref:alpha-galactosidase n=1 Tax=Aquisphaera insulae TaxID=2712864 RepID=UPI0013EAE5CA|nr:alpha-galactosidase [Aquisphaera insulae]
MRQTFVPFLLLVLVGKPVVAGPPDWLVDPSPFRATVREEPARHELVLENGLARRVIRLVPATATVSLKDLTTGEELLRAVGPEARVEFDGKPCAIGGLVGQPVANYLKDEWLATMKADPSAYRFVAWKEGPIEARFGWKKHPEWLSRDLPWPPPGRHVRMTYAPPRPGLPEVDVHYEIYDGLPLFSKWLVVRNTTDTAVRVTGFSAEEIRLAENESAVDDTPDQERPNLWVETDYAFLAMNGSHAARQSVSLDPDPDYPTQVNYNRTTRCLLRVAPPLGPDQVIAPKGTFESFRAFELLPGSTDRERRGLALRRMYRTIAPWSSENPLMFHVRSAKPEDLRRAIDQAADVGFELLIMTFGSGFDFESRDPAYRARYAAIVAEAKARGLALGGYSLLASRAAATPADNTQGVPARYGVMPCLGARWGIDYLAQLRSFIHEAGLGVLEHDGSYPGDRCNATNHPGHSGLADSQWAQWAAIADFYKWCRSEGVFLNVPDWYFLTGSNKTGMGYRETNWSLPRAEQEIIERQNVYDGTWTKSPSMGWMFVPLTEYQGGGAAATIEPLDANRDHYEARLANLLGAGVQACYRGPRLYDTEATRAVVKRWVDFYKAHRRNLDGDLIHLRRADGRDWDGWLHVDPQGPEKALAFLYNPLARPIEREIRFPLHYAGLSTPAEASIDGGPPMKVTLDAAENTTLKLTIPARGRTWILFQPQMKTGGMIHG